MAMTPERIAEIERIGYDGAGELSQAMFELDLLDNIDQETLAELCRLARLGLRVEGAPTTRAKDTPTAWRGPTWLAYEPLPNGWGGKRVALVVLPE